MNAFTLAREPKGQKKAVRPAAKQPVASAFLPDLSVHSNSSFDFSHIPVYSKAAGPHQNNLSGSSLENQHAQKRVHAEKSTGSPAGVLQRKCSCGGKCTSCQKRQHREKNMQSGHPELEELKQNPAANLINEILRSKGLPVPGSEDTATNPHLKTKNTFRPPQRYFSAYFSPVVQRASSNQPTSDRLPNSGDVPEIAGSTGFKLPDDIRNQANGVFQFNFDNVRFHTDQPARQAAARLSARAFTIENHVYFGSGWYNPGTLGGQHLIGHELTHVVQQRKGLSQIDLQTSGDRYEQEAEKAGEAFAHYKAATVPSAAGTHHTIQRSEDPGADAEIGAVADSPFDMPFLGEANTLTELLQLMRELQEPGSGLGLVSEQFAMGGDAPQSSPAVASAEPATDSGAAVQSSSLLKPLQMATVAGCNVPGVPANVIGMAAHTQIQGTCGAGFPGCVGEYPIPGDGRADLVRNRIPALTEIGEIKPASWLGRGMQAMAQAQLAGYLAAYFAAFGGVPPIPMWSFIYPGGPFSLNPSQRLGAWGPSSGIYYYSCTGGTRRRVRRRVRVPVPVPIIIPVPVPTPAPAPPLHRPHRLPPLRHPEEG